MATTFFQGQPTERILFNSLLVSFIPLKYLVTWYVGLHVDSCPGPLSPSGGSLDLFPVSLSASSLPL